ncbi:MAG: flavin reductase family protein [Acidimicrobiia bacterium]
MKGAVQPEDARDFRDMLGNFATGVVVVTGLHDDNPVGFSVNSFTSVSLEPPLVLFCIARESTTWPKIRASGVFAVNVLTEQQEDLCRTFASPGLERFDGVAWSQAPSGSPILDEALAWLDCTTDAVHPGGDHEIVLGRVAAMGLPDATRQPLIFYRGSYHRLYP